MDILSAIRKNRVEAIRKAKAAHPLNEIRELLIERTDYRSFDSAMNQSGIRVIAELKKSSPSRGLLVTDFRPELIARQYEDGGAAALSVLTEPEYFCGSLHYLTLARRVTSLPVLQKDFIVDDFQLYQGALAGADAVQLIATMLTESELIHLDRISRELGLTPVIEIHQREEMKSLKSFAKGTIVGINNRDLRSFATNVKYALPLVDIVLDNGFIPVVFSGIHGKSDIDLFAGRTNRFLVGEYLVSAPDRTATLRNLINGTDSGPERL